MLRNYLKIAFRALIRSKAHSAINIVGLSLGIASCILIVLYVNDEWTFDRFHSKAERIYRVYAREDWGENQKFFNVSTPFPMGPALKANFPEVESEVRINTINAQIKYGDNTYSEGLKIVGRDFFKVFDFATLKGNTQGAFDEQNNIVIEQWVAEKYFGNDDPINKVLSVQLGETFEEFNVVAVMKRVPTNSSVRFGFMISELNFPKLYSEQALTSAWFNISPETYVLLQEGVDPKSVEAKFPSVFKTLIGEEDFKASKYAPGLQPLTTIHLDTSFPAGDSTVSDPRYSLVLAAIALLILIVACINFVTLSIGRSLKRAKEVGIRKVVGAARKQLIVQFIGEAVLIATISTLVGVTISVLGLPAFNQLAGKSLVFPLDGFLLLVIASLLIIIGFISGSYPAFVLSAFRPVAILKGSIQSGGSKQNLRKVLVGVQLVLSIFLITCTLVMRNQLNFLQEKNLGFDKEQVVVVQLSVPRGQRMPERIKAGMDKAETFKTVLAGKPGIKAVCAASFDFANGSWVDVGYDDDKAIYRTFMMNIVDDDYITAMGMQMAQGRNFDEASTSDQRRAVIVNEAFAKEYGWTDAIGKKLPGKDFREHEVIGVVKDFNFTSLYTKVPPLVLVQDAAIILPGTKNINMGGTPVPKLMVRLSGSETAIGLRELESAWNQLASGEEFAFNFVDQALDQQYASDLNLGKIVSVATILAIIIGSLGLYGLASLAMQNRTKEITIRKVLGATEQSLLVLLSKEYIILVALSLLISVPLTIYMMQNWLSTFEYRVSIGWAVFLMSGGISLLIAVITIGHQTLKTAWTQPAQALKYE
jgi:putative ABC transport system permease protein